MVLKCMLSTMRFLIIIILALLCGCHSQTIECEEMRIEAIIQEATITLTWTINSCAQQYEVTHYVNGEVNLNLLIAHPLNFLPLERHDCSHNRVTISLIPVPGAGDFTEASYEFIVGFPGDSKVRDLQFNPELRRFEWLPPHAPEECDLEYNINFSNELIGTESTTPDEFYEFPVYFCSNNWISVTTIITTQGDSLVGDYAVGTHIEGIPDVLEVENLRFDEEQSRFLWEGPEYSEICDVQYEVLFENEMTAALNTIYDEFYQISVYPCSTNKISITTIIGFDGSRSDTVSETFNGPVKRQQPVHVSTDPRENGARVTWLIETEGNNFCYIQELIYEVEGVIDFRQPFQGYGLREFIISSLNPATEYRHRLCYSFQPPIVDTVCSEYISFLTKPLPNPSISLQVTDDNQILISWEQNDHPEPITAQYVYIEPVGPNHFVPSHCPINNEVIVMDIDPDMTSYLFDANPSFEYKIHVEIHFERLGMATSDIGTIITNEYMPGDLEIQSSYEFTPSVVFSVSLIVEWSIPCDINGNVESFKYTIKGTPDFEGVCGDFTLGTGSVEGSAGNNGIYSITNPNVLPFFKYSITVVTELRAHSATIEANLKDPPQPFTPQNYY